MNFVCFPTNLSYKICSVAIRTVHLVRRFVANRYLVANINVNRSVIKVLVFLVGNSPRSIVVVAKVTI